MLTMSDMLFIRRCFAQPMKKFVVGILLLEDIFMDWKFDNSIPIYIQVVDFIKKEIAKGVYAPGAILPGARDFAIQNKINPNAVQRAINQLVAEEILTCGNDGFVRVSNDALSDSKVKDVLIERRIKAFVDGMRELGIADSVMADYVTGYIMK